MHIAVVVQRYGDTVIGGAESQARQIVARLAADLGCTIDVLTTTAASHVTWARVFDQGATDDGPGVRILRFDPRWRRAPWFHALDRLTTAVHGWMLQRTALHPVLRALETCWLLSQGPVTPGLISHLQRHLASYDRVVFFTYLYYPTIWGVPIAGDKAVLIPEAHDEPAFRFLTVTSMLERVPRILVNTQAEQALITSRVPLAAARTRIAGLGVEPIRSRATPRPDQPPYLLCLGRLSRAKGVDRLLAYYARLAGTPGLEELRLILTGSKEPDVEIPASPGIEFRGMVPDTEKRDLLCGAAAVVNLSRWESLSLVVQEALAARTPAIVNADCPALLHYAEENATVIAVHDFEEFRSAVLRIVTTDRSAPDAAAALDAALRWVTTRYSWSRVLGAYREALGLTAGPGANPGDRSA